MNGLHTFISPNWPGPAFSLFSCQHLAAIAAIILCIALSIGWMKRLTPESDHRVFRYTVAALLVTQEITLLLWRLFTGQFHPGTSLPLHMCGIAVILCAVMLHNRNRYLFEINYFFGLGGATQAILTPNLGEYSFPHFL
ncbi:MAG: TIGR02206 family membrane protein [Spirochaetota bacterium]